MPSRPPLPLIVWLKGGCYLPQPLRDFHDQKDVFKTMHAAIDPANQSIADVSWVKGQCYVIDVFLWWMAKHGWTLQRTRAKVEGLQDMGARVKAFHDDEAAAFRAFMEERRAAKAAPNEG